MARIRNIKPDFYSHEELNDLENKFPELRPMLVFSGLWNQCEYSGVFSWSTRKLKLAILPFVDFDIEKSLNLLKEHGFIRRYQNGGKYYGHVINFTKYQAISGSEKSAGLKYPLPDDKTMTEPVESDDKTMTEPVESDDKTMTEPVESFESQTTADLGLRTYDLGHRTYDDDEEFRKNSLSSSDSKSFPQKESMPKQTSPPSLIPSDPAAVWEIIRNAWNGHNCRFTCDKIYFNLSYDQRERVRGSMATYTPGQMVRAIEKYFEERKEKPDGYEYKSFYLFVEKGMDFYTEAV